MDQRQRQPKPLLELLVIDGRPTMRGECDLSSSGAIDPWLAAFDGQPIDVDLSGVTFIDSSGLKALLKARRKNPGMRVVRPSAFVTRLFEMTSTLDYLVGDSSSPR